MIVDEQKFVRKYTLIYTFIISFILLSPLYLYVDYRMNLQEIKKEMELKSIQSHIINTMDNFGNHPDKTFNFPSFTSTKSGLYKHNFSPVYTQIISELPSFTKGYFKTNSKRYLITALPFNKYFFANYLVTESEISFTHLFLEASFIAFGIILLILLLSFYILNSFSRPFKRVNEKLDDFIKESMHEINTPLSIINVNVDLFNEIHGKNKYFNRIKSATKLLATIYNDMDYLIKQNRVEYENETINLNTYLHDRILYFELIAQLKNISLSLESTVNVTIDFNTTKLQRLIDNTLSNAIKYSNKNTQVEVSLKKVDTGIELTFKDYGQGIKNPKKILERYYREDSYKSGFGIGMCIVKSIIDEEDIDLVIESELGEGSTFTYLFHSTMIVKMTDQNNGLHLQKLD
ncbi:HAMP domain-containing histidine kinase [Sulfurimonas sp. SAG-AH-194-C21]|nr:HAMP domain-containing sensor histidine kinase [Sulfurimonas sp. SAG-AH-194-C21]MDF1882678.1 HAMP domain-containing histidine kinase [Sulfurimonas sp. SAG-AH-194-C21]